MPGPTLDMKQLNSLYQNIRKRKMLIAAYQAPFRLTFMHDKWKDLLKWIVKSERIIKPQLRKRISTRKQRRTLFKELKRYEGYISVLAFSENVPASVFD